MSQQQGEPFGPVEPPAPDLSLVSTDAILDELRRRHEVFYFIGRPHAKTDYNWRQHWGDKLDRVLGLIEIGKAHLLRPETDDH